MQTLIVFGSAVTGHEPHDIDVASERPLGGEDVERVRDWARARGLDRLRIDEHQLVQRGYFALRTAQERRRAARVRGRRSALPVSRLCPVPPRALLPAPCGVQAPYAELPGGQPVEVQHVGYWSIPAILRVHGATPAEAVRAWEALRDDRLSLFGCLIDVGAHDGAHDWANYTTGIVALRSAIAKIPNNGWDEISAQVPEGPLLAALAAHGPSPEGVAWARARSSGSGARLLLRADGVCTQYGSEVLPYGSETTAFMARLA